MDALFTDDEGSARWSAIGKQTSDPPSTRASSIRTMGADQGLSCGACATLLKPAADADHLRLVLSATATPRQPEGPKRHRRQRQHRLSRTGITKLIKKYEQQVPVKDLAKQFGNTA